MYTERQRKAVHKAVKEGYLDYAIPAVVRDWLLSYEPLDTQTASNIMALVLGIAYAIGINDPKGGPIWDPAIRYALQQEKAQDLVELMEKIEDI
jgi:hypothetical protein